MAFVDPNTIHNPATGTIAPASWGDNVRDNLVYFYDTPHAKCINSGSIAATTATLTAVTFSTEEVDTDAIHSTSANTSRFTCQTAGRYRFNGAIHWENNATGYRLAQVRLNGVGGTILDESYLPSVSANSEATVRVCGSYVLAVADYIELYGLQSSGGNLNILGSASFPSFFEMRWESGT